MAGRIGLSGLDGNCSGRSAECLLGPGCSMVPRRFQRLATPNVEHLSGARLRAQRAFDHGGIGAAIAPDFLQVPTKLPLSAHCSKRAPIVEGYSPENDVMNALPDYGDYVSADIRWSIQEEAVQVWVYWNGVLAEGYELEIASMPTDCKAWINLLEQRYGQNLTLLPSRISDINQK